MKHSVRVKTTADTANKRGYLVSNEESEKSD